MCRVENSAVHSRLCVCLSGHRDLSPQTARLRKVCFLPPSVASCNCILQPTYAAVRCSSCAALTRGSDPAGLKDTALRAGLFTRMGVRSAQRRRHAPPVPRDCRAHWRTGAGNARDTGVAAQLPAAFLRILALPDPVTTDGSPSSCAEEGIEIKQNDLPRMRDCASVRRPFLPNWLF